MKIEQRRSSNVAHGHHHQQTHMAAPNPLDISVRVMARRIWKELFSINARSIVAAKISMLRAYNGNARRSLRAQRRGAVT